MRQAWQWVVALSLVCAASLGSCASVRCVATTTLVGHIVSQIGGEAIDLTVLLPPGADPHSFEPTPMDLVAVARADVVFISGAGLETDLAALLENASGPVVSLSENVDLRTLSGSLGESETGDYEGTDPHVWLDPSNVGVWAVAVADTLAELDPDDAAAYRDRAALYQVALAELDAWIVEQVARIPVERRKLVTDHTVLGYFAARYGFEQVGTVFPGFSTLAEPSAREIAALEDVIIDLGVPAVFVGTTVNPMLAEQIAIDTNTRLIFLYTGSLSEPDGPASSYIELMYYNMNAMVEGLLSGM